MVFKKSNHIRNQDVSNPCDMYIKTDERLYKRINIF